MKKTAIFQIALAAALLLLSPIQSSAAKPKDGALTRVAAPGKIIDARVAAASGGYVVAATLSTADARGGTRAWAAKIGPKGKRAWELRPGGKRKESSLKSAAGSGAGALMAGALGPMDDEKDGVRNAWLLKVDKAGLIRWERPFGFNGASSAAFLDLQNDDSILVAGSTAGKDGAVDGFISEFDSDGNLLWGRRYPGRGAVIWAGELGDASYAAVTKESVAALSSDGGVLWEHATDAPMAAAADDDSITLAAMARRGVLRVTTLDENGVVTLDTTVELADACSLAGLYLQGGRIMAGGGTCGKGKHRIWTASISRAGELLTLSTHLTMMPGYGPPTQISREGGDGFMAAGTANGTAVWIYRSKFVKKEPAKAKGPAKKKRKG